MTPLHFADALTHWAGRGRTLYGGINWSSDPTSVSFLGFIGNKHYPLGVPIWQAITAIMNNGWTDAVARVHGVLFWVCLLSTVWLTVWRISHCRKLAAGATFILAALPLNTWHALSGYADIGVEVYIAATVAALLRKDWLLAGFLTAGAAWIKNDGLLFIPAVTLITVTINGSPLKQKSQTSIMHFLLGISLILPWLTFKTFHNLGLTPNQERFSWHPEAPFLFFKYAVLGPSHSFFWPAFAFILAFTFKPTLTNNTGRGLLIGFIGATITICSVFWFSDAFIFLKNQMTIHRSLLQLYGLAIITAAHAIHLSRRKGTS